MRRHGLGHLGAPGLHRPRDGLEQRLAARGDLRGRLLQRCRRGLGPVLGRKVPERPRRVPADRALGPGEHRVEPRRVRPEERRDATLVQKRRALRLRSDEPKKNHRLEFEVERHPADEEEGRLEQREEGVDDPVGKPLASFFFFLERGLRRDAVPKRGG